MQERYGIRRTPATRRRAVIGVIALAVVFLAVVVYVGIQVASVPIRTQTLSYEHVSNHEVAMSFQVTMSPGTEARCRVQAFDSHRAQVGFLSTDIPAQKSAISTHRVVIRTQQPAVSADVMDCTAR